jgi:hypothetical protein
MIGPWRGMGDRWVVSPIICKAQRGLALQHSIGAKRRPRPGGGKGRGLAKLKSIRTGIKVSPSAPIFAQCGEIQESAEGPERVKRAGTPRRPRPDYLSSWLRLDAAPTRHDVQALHLVANLLVENDVGQVNEPLRAGVGVRVLFG